MKAAPCPSLACQAAQEPRSQPERHALAGRERKGHLAPRGHAPEAVLEVAADEGLRRCGAALVSRGVRRRGGQAAHELLRKAASVSCLSPGIGKDNALAQHTAAHSRQQRLCYGFCLTVPSLQHTDHNGVTAHAGAPDADEGDQGAAKAAGRGGARSGAGARLDGVVLLLLHALHGVHPLLHCQQQRRQLPLEHRHILAVALLRSACRMQLPMLKSFGTWRPVSRGHGACNAVFLSCMRSPAQQKAISCSQHGNPHHTTDTCIAKEGDPGSRLRQCMQDIAGAGPPQPLHMG